MARNRSMFHNVVVFGLLALAFYGGWVLYGKYENDIDWTTEKVGKTVKATKRVWKE